MTVILLPSFFDFRQISSLIRSNVQLKNILLRSKEYTRRIADLFVVNLLSGRLSITRCHPEQSLNEGEVVFYEKMEKTFPVSGKYMNRKVSLRFTKEISL